MRLLTQIVETAATLAGDEAVPHLLDAAETALRALRWPSHTPDYVARIAPTPRMQTVWRLPRGRGRSAGARRCRARQRRRAREALAVRLKALQGAYPPRGKIALTGHAHIDLAWLWPYAETRRKLRRTFHTALGLLARSPGFHLQPVDGALLRRDRGGRSGAVRRDPRPRRRGALGADRRHVGGAGHQHADRRNRWCANCSMASTISSGRSARASRVCWLPDCFGFSPALPQLLAQAGIDSFFTIKVYWSETNRFPHDLFWWEGLDGTRVLAHIFDNPLAGYNGFVRARWDGADLGAISARRTVTTRLCWRSAMATAAAA